MSPQPFRRILLKISGEMLMGKDPFGINHQACDHIAESLHTLQKAGLETAIVLGGGNIFRGVKHAEIGLRQTPADNIGMLATLMNGIALQEILIRKGCPSTMMSALDCPQVAAPYQWKKALELLSKGEILLFVGGTGNPYFTTDTAAALRATEINADILLKATKVDGIYDKDPITHTDAMKYETLSYTEALEKRLKVMDATAFALCMNNHIPIFVFNMKYLTKDDILNTLHDPHRGTLVTEEK